MRLLVVTQEIDTESKTLSFFHEWILSLAARVTAIEVICLKEGKHALPENVHVHSLGKERGEVSSIVYACRFIGLVWKLRSRHDAVFVHMNQEYILIAGWLWRLMQKPVYLWRNHYAGSWLTTVAAYFCTKIFCTSRHSYTARYQKTTIMPVGVDVAQFESVSKHVREPDTILFLARISPSKHLEILIDALATLHAQDIDAHVSIVGDHLPEDAIYVAAQKRRIEEAGLSNSVHFYPGVPHTETVNYYARNALFVNCSQSGMFDKTLFEASAAGCLVLAMSDDFADLTDGQSMFSTAGEVAKRVQELLQAPSTALEQYRNTLQQVAQEHSLESLSARLISEMSLQS